MRSVIDVGFKDLGEIPPRFLLLMQASRVAGMHWLASSIKRD